MICDDLIDYLVVKRFIYGKDKWLALSVYVNMMHGPTRALNNMLTLR